MASVPARSRCSPPAVSTMPRERNDGGFALIEALIAMVILSIGLLGLNAMAVGAATSNARSERMSRATLTASEFIEVALYQMRNGQPVEQLCVNPGFEQGDRVSLRVDASDASRLGVTAVITARPARPGNPLHADTIVSYAYRATDAPIVVTGAPCP